MQQGKSCIFKKTMTKLLGLRTSIYQVTDLQKAKNWYSEALQIQPYFNQPFYVGFNIGGYELGLHPETEKTETSKSEAANSYWGVENAEKSYEDLIKFGATAFEKPFDVGDGVMMAAVKDPWGNVLGVIQNVHFKIGDKITDQQTLLMDLQVMTQGLIWTSESDEIWTVDELQFERKNNEKISNCDTFFDYPTQDKSWHSPYEKVMAERYRRLKSYLQSHFSNLTVVKQEQEDEQIRIFIICENEGQNKVILATKATES